MEALRKEIDGFTDEQRKDFERKLQEASRLCEASYCASLLRWDRAFLRDEKCRKYGEGEYHVYMWLHADGTPFYVGSGKGDRWKSTNRNERFFEETKKLDTLVVKIIDGLTQQESREAEFCLSHYLTYNGYNLANWDNNFFRCIDQKQEDKRVGKYVRLTKSPHNSLTIEQAKEKIHPYKMKCDCELMRKQYILSYGSPL